MKVGFPLDSAAHGIHRGMQAVDDSARAIASAEQAHGAGPEGITRHLVDMGIAQSNVEASARVVRAVDEMLGTIIDTLA